MAKLEATGLRGYWSEQIAKAKRRYKSMHTSGDAVIDRYRVERTSGGVDTDVDKYNMLYSSTETIRPSLYAQTPKPQVQPRHKDRTNPTVTIACALMETALSYSMAEMDFDEVINNVVEDYALPGLGTAWVRYDPTFTDATDDSGKPVMEADGKTPAQAVSNEAIALDYVHWKDILYGPCRTWAELPWVARAVYLTKTKVTERFGASVANAMTYDTVKVDNERNVESGDENQAIIWEIWHLSSRKVIFYSDGYAADIIEAKDDPLRLKNFFPTPRPLRAITNTRTFVPRPLFSQYQNQQREMDKLTNRIRLLTDALKVRGVYNAQYTALAALLDTAGGNKMIPVEAWEMFGQNGGLKAAVDFLPITEIAACLIQLYDARDRVKGEIYEITGFGDIVRGATKASETLGAQRIKNDWASARLKKMQREVQRFIRDIVQIMGEIMAEHFSDATLAEYAGYDAPTDTQGAAAYHAAFKQVVAMLRTERERCAQIDIETDSTILADEQQERQDRLEFLGQMGAFLQQAGPMVMEFPDMRGLMGSLMMFAVRTFPSSRPVQQAFESFEKLLAQQPPQKPGGDGKGDNGAAAAQSAVQTATIKAQTDDADSQRQDATKRYEIDSRLRMDAMVEQNRHSERMLELQIKEIEAKIKAAELGILQEVTQRDTAVAQHTALLSEADQQHQHQQDVLDGQRSDAEFAAGRVDAANAQQESAASATNTA